MSASLVGSEMCIRDRITAASAAAQRPRRNHRCSAAAPAGAPAQHHGSVSYTHLTLPTICSV
eukprot:5425763-Alexandrium_andersonii.AAC.1